MKKIGLGFGILLLIIIVGVFTDISEKNAADVQLALYIESKRDLIVLSEPAPKDIITSPLSIKGQARGYWFFEASFPVLLIDAEGNVIAEGFVSAQSDWMTEDLVPFAGTLEFSTTPSEGVLVLQKANASDLPEHDDSLEIPVTF